MAKTKLYALEKHESNGGCMACMNNTNIVYRPNYYVVVDEPDEWWLICIDCLRDEFAAVDKKMDELLKENNEKF